MSRTLALVVCLVTVAAACGSDGDADSDVTADADAAVTESPSDTDASPAEPEPEPTTAPEPAPETETETEPTTAPEPETEPAPELNAVGLVPLPGAQLDFTGQQVDVPTLVWSLYSGSGGVIIENLGGPIPPGCHGASFFDPQTFDLLQIDGTDADGYATAGQGGCDGIQQDLEDGLIDGPAVKVNNDDLIVFDFGSLPAPPFDVSTQILDPDGSDGIFRSADPLAPLPINDLTGATHAVGVTGVFAVDPGDQTLRRVQLPTTADGPGCSGGEALCLGNRFEINIVDPVGSPASAVGSGDNGGRFYFFGDHDANILVSVLNGCDITNRFWVFAAATTSIEYELTVTDTTTGDITSYASPLDEQAIVDTGAFATCP